MRRDDLVNDDITARVQGIDLAGLESELEAQGWAVLGSLLTAPECDHIASLYTMEAGFRSHVVMARYGFGRGEYRYFSYPLLASADPRRCCCSTALATTTACTRTCTESMSFRCKWRCCSPSLASTSAVVNSC